jgi:hypothetical protein
VCLLFRRRGHGNAPNLTLLAHCSPPFPNWETQQHWQLFPMSGPGRGRGRGPAPPLLLLFMPPKYYLANTIIVTLHMRGRRKRGRRPHFFPTHSVGPYTLESVIEYFLHFAEMQSPLPPCLLHDILSTTVCFLVHHKVRVQGLNTW